MKFNFSTKRSFKHGLILLILVINFLFINSDLPVHCKREQIEGEWIFRVESKSFEASLNDPQTSCGHGFPDRIERTVGDKNFRFDSYRDLTLFLGSDYKIYESKENKKIVGHWTPIYDEAFVVYYGNSVFTAFMKYYLKDSSSYDDKNYISNCDKTMIGWYVPDSNQNNKNWSCFFGFKSKVRNQFTPNRFLQKNNFYQEESDLNNLNSNDFNTPSNFMEMSAKTHAQLSLQMMKYDQKELVNEINSMNLPWKAEIHEEFKGLSFFELKEKLGLRREKSRNFRSNNYMSSFDDMKVFDSMNTPSSIEEKDNSSSDLSSLDGIDSMLNSWSSLEINGTVKNSKKHRKKNYDPHPNGVMEPPGSNLLDEIKEINENFNYEQGSGSRSDLENIRENSSFSNKINNFNKNLNYDNYSKKSDTFHSRSSAPEEDSYRVTDVNVIQKYLDKELNEIDVNTLPKNWDWRNVGGVNYVPPPRRQLNCGSCYIFSLVSSLESRLRILTNNQDKTEFSRQFPLGCSFYTEGCKGGYPFLVAKFFHEFEVIPESCAPYNPNNVKCSDTCDYTKNPTKYFVSKYEYLGGFYGATNEIDLIKEIRHSFLNLIINF